MKIINLLLVAFLWLGQTSHVNAQNLPDRVAFFNTIERGDLAQARTWLDAGLRPDFEGHLVGSGLMIGAWEGNLPMMQLFLERGADINKVNAFGEQALLHAAWKGHLPAVRWLVEHGARLDRDGKAWAALHYAAFAGHDEIAAFLLERGADRNALSVNGSTPLMMAAREGKEAIATRLLAAGARTDIVNDAGENAVNWAMRNNNLTLARTIGGSENFARAAAQAPASRPRAVRSQPVPDRVDMLLAQARKLEAAGMRDAALKVYRAALASLSKAGADTRTARAPARSVSGMVITARRGDPAAQSAGLSYSTPAAGTNEQPATKVGADKPTKQQGGRAKDALLAVANGDTANTAASTVADPVDEWLRRGRELEAAGRRAEALHAYRQASAALNNRR
jgi:tetratricopeptide (TPR) repeat protein